MKLTKLVVIMASINIGLFVFNVSNDPLYASLFFDLNNPVTGLPYTDAELAILNDNPDSFENITIGKDENATLELDSGSGINIGQVFNTLFLVLEVFGTILIAQLFAPWTILQGLGFPQIIAFPIGIILLILNFMALVEAIANR